MKDPYIERRVPGRLSRWVECCWSIDNKDPITGHAVRPDGCIDLLFSRSGGLRIVGAMTKERRFDLKPGEHSTGIRLRPGMARAFFGIPSHQLTDCSVFAEDLIGRRARPIAEQLAETASFARCMQLLITALGEPRYALNPAQLGIEMMTTRHGVVSLDEVSRHAGLSARQFRRRCLDESGLSPKQLSRILRFRHALMLAGQAGQPDWASLAQDAGYFDQAHLIRDFHEFAGATPVSVFSKPAQRNAAMLTA